MTNGPQKSGRIDGVPYFRYIRKWLTDFCLGQNYVAVVTKWWRCGSQKAGFLCIIKWNIKRYSPLRRKQSIIQNISCVSFMCQWILQYSRARKRRSNDSNSQNPEMLLWVFLCRKGFYCVFCGVVALIQYFSQAFCQIEYLTVSGSQLNWLKKSLLDFITIGKAFNTCLNKECWGDAFCIPGLPFHLHHLQN